MIDKLLRVTLFLTLASCVPPPPVYSPGDDLTVDAEPPSPLPEAMSDSPWPGATWIAGFWSWSGVRYVWLPGRWERSHDGWRWLPHRWERGTRGWRLIAGRWVTAS